MGLWEASTHLLDKARHFILSLKLDWPYGGSVETILLTQKLLDSQGVRLKSAQLPGHTAVFSGPTGGDDKHTTISLKTEKCENCFKMLSLSNCS